ncbi:Zinc finger C2H2-type protein [Lasiodiplodia theobromae]|nr:Zinc finger C2H2-type protein [Lasiodiplodia theobromae]
MPENLCPRCLESFKSEADLREHSRARSPCLVDTETHIEGITRDQEKVLKSKKRTSKSGSNTAEEKWREIYSILFPDEAIPDAFCKTIGTEDLMKDTLTAVKRDLPEFVAQRLKDVSSELFPFSLEDPIPQITQIVSDGLDRFIPDSILTDIVSEYPASVRTERSPDSSAFQSSPDVIFPSDIFFSTFVPTEEDANGSTARHHSPSPLENNADHRTDDFFDIVL